MIGKLPEKKDGRGTEYMASKIRDTIWHELTNLHKYNIVLLPGADEEDFRLSLSNPTIIWIHVPAYEMPLSVSRFFEDYAVLENTKAYVVQSEFHKRDISDAFDIPLDKIYVINNTFDPVKFVPKPIGTTNLIYTSQASRGLDILLEAFSQIKDDSLRLTIHTCDCNACTSEYAGLIDLDSRVRLVGITEKQVYFKNLQLAHLYAYPCRFQETAGIGIMEAMSAGVKIVCTDLGALPETTLGYAKIVKHFPIYRDSQDRVKTKYAKKFKKEIIKAVKQIKANRFDPSKQIAAVNEAFSLDRVQNQWRDFNSKM